MVHLTPAESARRLLRPRLIAVIGASPQLSKINGRPLKHLLEKGYAGAILPVNPKYTEIAGLPCYPDVESLPDVPDLAIVALPAREVETCIVRLARVGVPAAVIFSSGFAEMGDEGKDMQSSLQARARECGIAFCGPNCLGFVNAFDNVYATFSQYADGDTRAGPVAFVTQSGAFGTAIATLIRERSLGVGYFINTGNEAGLSFSDLMLTIIDDPRIKVGAGYLEGVRDGPGLIRLARRCTELRKPLVLMKVGRMAAGARAAASHTGALALEDDVFDAVVTQYGVLRARNEEQMLDMLEVLCSDRAAKCAGNAVGIATQSGGAAVMMADRSEELGLQVPALKPATQEALARALPAFAAVGNPVDVTGQFLARPSLLRDSVITLLSDPGIDVGIVWLQLMTAHVDLLVNMFREVRERSDKLFIVCWLAAPTEAVQRLRAAGIVVFGGTERAVEAVAAVVRYRRVRDRIVASLRDTEDIEAAVEQVRAGVPGAIRDGAQATVQASEWLAAAGIPMAPVVLATTPDEAVHAWREFDRPVALKVESRDIPHKTEIGGVLLDRNDEAAVRAGFATLISRAPICAPHARVDGVIVQPMVQGHLELVVGVNRDAAFGMVVMAGLGGMLVEVLKDVTFRCAPFSAAEALLMLDALRMRPLLDGVRGQPAVDRHAIADLLSRVSVWAAAMEPWLEELDLNPVLAGPIGATAVDCVMILKRGQAA
jgi:acetyltransferase